ncbi:hypothetical protein G6F22_017016 [Rhizopus arrhizus]|nr:hypothetical protein G6F22_017016 [Rhizopus arrhizus]
MEGAAAAHAEAERGDLGAADVDARGTLAAFGTDVPLGQGIDEGLLDAADIVAHTNAQPRQAQQRIDHDLAGTVIGHLAAAVHVQHRDLARRQHMLVLASLAQGEHRIVLDHPQLVGVGAWRPRSRTTAGRGARSSGAASAGQLSATASTSLPGGRAAPGAPGRTARGSRP